MGEEHYLAGERQGGISPFSSASKIPGITNFTYLEFLQYKSAFSIADLANQFHSTIIFFGF
jgi:hypothetical protein